MFSRGLFLWTKLIGIVFHLLFVLVAPTKSSGMQLSFSNKVSAIPQFLSFKHAQEDRSRKIGHDPLVSFGYISISNADAFDTNQKAYSGTVQVCFCHCLVHGVKIFYSTRITYICKFIFFHVKNLKLRLLDI